MAEDEVIDEDLNIEEGHHHAPKRKVYGGYSNRQCNARLEELAKPKKWLMLATWREHRYIFDQGRMQMLKEKIQEEFSMTPEETEMYFNQLRSRARRILNRKALAKQIRREKALAKEEAYRILKKLLRKAMKYAFLNPPPPIVSPVLRETSNKILRELCYLHGVCVPKRNNDDKKSLFLLYLSDWAAILISNVYYELNVNEKVEGEHLKPIFSKESVHSSEESDESEGEEGEKTEEELEEEDDVSDKESPVIPQTTSGTGEGEGGPEYVSEVNPSPAPPADQALDETDAEEDFGFPE
ncbi:hypothetical protein Trydic_g20800 [Trypoxylus dichotomus]